MNSVYLIKCIENRLSKHYFENKEAELYDKEYNKPFFSQQLSLDNSSMIVTDRYIVTDDFTPKPGHEHEIALIKGQTVDILGRPPGSASWRVRIMDSDVTGDAEGLVPFNVLKKIEESPLRNKRSSVETLHSQSSEGT